MALAGILSTQLLHHHFSKPKPGTVHSNTISDPASLP
jgi:hypothetical protein